MLKLVIEVVLAAWLLLTVVILFKFRASEWLASKDVLGLIPQWTFFAPNPKITDYYLLIRDIGTEGPGPWVQHIEPGERGALYWLWSPSMRLQKTLNSVVKVIMVTSDHPKWQLLLPYAALTSAVQLPCRTGDAKGRQFAVLAAKPGAGDGRTREFEVILRSEVHPLV